MALFALKVLSKVLGMLLLDFDDLYWLVFLLSDPMTVIVVVLSVVLVCRGVAGLDL